MRIGAISFVPKLAAAIGIGVATAAPGYTDEALLNQGLKEGTLNRQDTSHVKTEKGCCWGDGAIWEALFRAPHKLSGIMDLEHVTGAVLWNVLKPNDPVPLPENVKLDDGRIVPFFSATPEIASKAQRIFYTNNHAGLINYPNYATWRQKEGNQFLVHSIPELAAKADKNFIPLKVIHLDEKEEPAYIHYIIARIRKNQIWVIDPNNLNRKWTRTDAYITDNTLTLRYNIRKVSDGKPLHEVWDHIYLPVNSDRQDSSVFSEYKK